jgi:hypothetical protein
MTLHHAGTVLAVSTKITIVILTIVACVGVFIATVVYQWYFKFLPSVALNGSVCEG